ncbi:MAG: NosD domain-containing protein [Thermoplasmatota archaeon]
MHSRMVFFAMAILLMGTFVPLLSIRGEEERTRAAHLPILITSNSDMATQASSESWTGSGTYNDPYIIENYEIDADGYVAGISISGTNRYLIIRNCRVHDANYRGEGINVKLSGVKNISLVSNIFTKSLDENIQVQSSSHIIIDDNSISGSAESHGIHVGNSQWVDIGGNTISANKIDGIRCGPADDILIDDNLIRRNGNSGISLTDTRFGLVLKNTIESNDAYGVNIAYGNRNLKVYANDFKNDTLEIGFDMRYSKVSSNNTIDGRPIYQYTDADHTGDSVPRNASMVLAYNITGLEIKDIDLVTGGRFAVLLNSDNLTISGLNIEGGDTQIGLNTCQDVKISNCTFQNARQSIFPAYCTRLTVENNLMEGVNYGVTTYYNWDLVITGNRITGCENGIYLYSDQDPTVQGNEISGYYEIGIDGTFLKFSSIYGNTIKEGDPSSQWGVRIANSDHPIIIENFIAQGAGGVNLSECPEGTVSHNLIEDNSMDGVLIKNSMDNRVGHNIIFNNSGFGLNLLNVGDAIIWSNSFIGNSMSTSTYNPLRIQARDDGTSNQWSLTGWGNFWSDWTGPDDDGDGLVDTPYIIRGGDNYDLLPLTSSYRTYLSEPLNLTANAGNGNVTLSWKQPTTNLDSGISGFTIYRSEGDSPSTTEFEVDGDTYQYLDIGLTNNIEYHYFIAAENKYGEGRQSDVVTAMPDGDPPTIEILLPEDGLLINSTEVTIEWTGTDDISSVMYQWRLDSGNWTDVGTDTSTNLVNLTEGNHVFFLAGIDQVGNRVEVNGSISVDLTPPEIWFLNEDEWKLTNSSSVIIEWNWTDIHGIGQWKLNLDGVSIPGPLNSTKVEIDGLEDGQHTLEISVSDMAGNSNTITANLLVDTTAPIILITRPSDGLNTLNRTILATWVIVEEGAGLDWTEVKLDDGNWTDAGSFDVFLLEDLLPGPHSFSVRCSDLVGNVGQRTVDFEVFEEDLPPETVTIMGYVTNEKGEPLEGVEVTSDDGHETSTDTEGFFILVVEKGIRKLTFKRSGYEDLEKNVDANLNITLGEGEIVMEKKGDDSRDLSNINRFCLFICIAPFVVIVFLAILGFIWRKIRGGGHGRIEE